MALASITAYTVACNACAEFLEDDGGGTLFSDASDAADVARSYGWAVIGDAHVCPVQDVAHQKFIDQAMPPEPASQAPGQLAIGEE